jgi:uncharacterized membrane protein YedE/YeeE
LKNKDVFCFLFRLANIDIRSCSFPAAGALPMFAAFTEGEAMSIDWANFTPWQALGGGMLIGLSAALLFVSGGRIAGISGLLGSLVEGRQRDVAWRVFFLLGLVAAPGLGWWLLPGGWPESSFSPATPGAWAALGIGGLLVGFGTRLANGCTSGHGVCGLARLSRRSLVAVLCFMASGMATVFLVRHAWGG